MRSGSAGEVSGTPSMWPSGVGEHAAPVPESEPSRPSASDAGSTGLRSNAGPRSALLDHGRVGASNRRSVTRDDADRTRPDHSPRGRWNRSEVLHEVFPFPSGTLSGTVPAVFRLASAKE